MCKYVYFNDLVLPLVIVDFMASLISSLQTMGRILVTPDLVNYYLLSSYA